MVKHPNESRFEFALRLTKALKDSEQVLMDKNYRLDSKFVLDILYDEIMHPMDPLQEPKIGEWADYCTAPPMEAPAMTWSLATDMVNAAVKQAYANRDRTSEWFDYTPQVEAAQITDDMEDEFNEFSPSVMEEAAPKVDQSFVDSLKRQLVKFGWKKPEDVLLVGSQGNDHDSHWGI